MRERLPLAVHFLPMTQSTRLTVAAAALCLTAAAFPAHAAQSRSATPYPAAVGGNAQVLDPSPQRGHGPQRLQPDPYPQIIGDNAQGNPPITRVRRHQRLVSSSYQRRYRVDRP